MIETGLAKMLLTLTLKKLKLHVINIVCDGEKSL